MTGLKCPQILLIAAALLGWTMCTAAAPAAADTPASSATQETVAGPVLRRLTRVEYANSLRDLFGIDFPFAAELPADGQAGGFDNNGDALSLTPVLLESYLKVARKTGALVMGLGSTSTVAETFPAKGNQSAWLEGLPMGTRGGVRVEHYFPRDGEYELRAFTDYITAGGGRASAVTPPPLSEGTRFFRRRLKVKAGLHTYFVTFPDEFGAQEGSVPNLNNNVGTPGLGGPVDILNSAIKPKMQFWFDGKKIQTFDIHGPAIGEAAFEVQPGPPVLARAEIVGPYQASTKVDTLARRKLLTCSPKKSSEESACAAKILQPVARRAYRRPVDAQDMSRVMAAFERKRAAGGFDEAIGMGLSSILISPDFLFRVELDPADGQAGKNYRVSATELATRLSFFLWSSIPDESLLAAGEHDRLQGDALQNQIQRMLADPKADALIDNFAMQWLDLRQADAVRPDLRAYPEFDESLLQAFRRETQLFMRSLMRENRSILDVISSDYTFVNEKLAKLYGIEGVSGDAFRKVKLKDDGQRGGVLGHASVLLASSHPAQTSPILRGKWVLANLMNSPPPAPPPGVPPLDTKPSSEGRALTTREQIERHRISPVCTGCHVKMDPYGIALENYDVMGRWRTEENGSPLDTSTRLPRGEPFTGPAGLKKTLLKRSDEFATATVSRLMIYALGRKLEKSDDAAIKQIVQAAKPNNYRFNDIVLGIVNSQPFQMRPAAMNVAVAPSQEPREALIYSKVATHKRYNRLKYKVCKPCDAGESAINQSVPRS